MKKSKAMTGTLIVVLFALMCAPLAAVGPAGEESDPCDVWLIGCIVDAASLSLTAGPLYVAMFSDFLPPCDAAFIWCKRYSE